MFLGSQIETDDILPEPPLPLFMTGAGRQHAHDRLHADPSQIQDNTAVDGTLRPPMGLQRVDDE
eukprot:2814706-Lingulodinium_polyedra.AAC.1